MKRANLNLSVDVGALFILLLLVSTGLVLEFRLPAGSGGHEPYGLGHRALDRPIEMIWGWTRHEWGEVHFWIACVFVALLAVHLLLHWKWIVSMCNNLNSNFFRVETLVLFVGLIACVGLVVLPLLSSKERTTLREQQATQSTPATSALPN